jgi:hypothetical protein
VRRSASICEIFSILISTASVTGFPGQRAGFEL